MEQGEMVGGWLLSTYVIIAYFVGKCSDFNAFLVAEWTLITGIYKDDDDRYSLQSLLKRQEEGDEQ